MSIPTGEWEHRAATLWNSLENYGADAFVGAVNALVAELPSKHPVGLFELGCAQDSTDHPDLAVSLYVAALGGGLLGIRRRRAVIQMSSSLRHLGESARAVDLLEAELEEASYELDGAVRGFLALALADVGRGSEALAHSLKALAAYLPRYNTSLSRYADIVGKRTSWALPGC